MDKIISQISNHYIICGCGRVGHQIVEELKAEKVPFVVIDGRPEAANEFEALNIPCVIGDSSSDLILEKAGVKRARVLFAASDSDTANVFVTLSARVLNPKIFIVARASQIESEEKLRKAGANRVISPYFLAGKRMSAMAFKPVAVDFLDLVMHSENIEMEMREYHLKQDCKACNSTLADTQIKQKSGATILAIKRADGKFELQPNAESRLCEGDIVVAIGTKEQLEKLAPLFNKRLF